MNYKLTLQYDGTEFHGWQIQDEHRTVQGELTRAVSLLEGSDVAVYGSGRTDAGVHAEGQVASVVLRREFTPQKLRAAVNGNLARDVRVMEVEDVPDDFHARYSARGKTYIYRIVNSGIVSPFLLRYAHGEARPLDLESMAESARSLVGEHDWSAFCSAQTDSQSRVRNVTELEILESRDERACAAVFVVKVSANGFLRYMVRSIVGALLAVGRGDMDRNGIEHAIESGERPQHIVTAPACGLTLWRVHYD